MTLWAICSLLGIFVPSNKNLRCCPIPVLSRCPALLPFSENRLMHRCEGRCTNHAGMQLRRNILVMSLFVQVCACYLVPSCKQKSPVAGVSDKKQAVDCRIKTGCWQGEGLYCLGGTNKGRKQTEVQQRRKEIKNLLTMLWEGEC